jgi:ubiquinone/menaquinone biosynthesis C-methylase UbiE
VNAPPVIRFVDGGAYEQYMGVWSQLVGARFLDWLTPRRGLRWLDVGCGNGAFTELLIRQCAPALTHGIDPAPAQLAFARTRPALASVVFDEGNAMALPYADHAFDAAVMPLVIFFVADPLRGVQEMARVVAPGGTVSAYAWDMEQGGFPYHVLQEELHALGAVLPVPPSPDASRLEVLESLWRSVGLESVESTAIHVTRTFASIDDYWQTVQQGPSVGPTLAAMSDADRATLQARLARRLPPDAHGRVTYAAQANAVRGVTAGAPAR